MFYTVSINVGRNRYCPRETLDNSKDSWTSTHSSHIGDNWVTEPCSIKLWKWILPYTCILTHRKEAKRVKNKYSQFQSAFNQKVIIFQSIWINMTCSQEEWWIIHVYNYSFGEQCQGDIELFINLKHKCRWSIPSRSNRSLTECSNFRCLSKISLIKTIQPYNISH